MKENEKLSIGWCDRGTVDTFFMSGILETTRELPLHGITLEAMHSIVGGQIAGQRQRLIDEWYESGVDWLLWIDSDVVINSHIVKELLSVADKDERPVVCGVYFVSPNPNEPLMIPYPCIYKDTETGIIPIHPLPEKSLIKIDVAGFGLTLMHRSIVDKIKDIYNGIYFDIDIRPDGKGEDVSFFRKLKEQNIPVYAHTGCLAVHMKTFVFDINYYKFYWDFVWKQLSSNSSVG